MSNYTRFGSCATEHRQFNSNLNIKWWGIIKIKTKPDRRKAGDRNKKGNRVKSEKSGTMRKRWNGNCEESNTGMKKEWYEKKVLIVVILKY